MQIKDIYIIRRPKWQNFNPGQMVLVIDQYISIIWWEENDINK